MDTITFEKEDKGECVSSDRAVVRCKQCGQVRGGNTINPPHFALSHFSNHTMNSCKQAAAKEAHATKAVSFNQLPEGPKGLYVVDAKRMSWRCISSPATHRHAAAEHSLACLAARCLVQGINALAT
jgi:hypothetical protein